MWHIEKRLQMGNGTSKKGSRDSEESTRSPSADKKEKKDRSAGLVGRFREIYRLEPSIALGRTAGPHES